MAIDWWAVLRYSSLIFAGIVALVLVVEVLFWLMEKHRPVKEKQLTLQETEDRGKKHGKRKVR